ncbi:MAG: lipopolysaccharide heptosyltransferase I [Proteobacteria bacterium]|nr:lipopolysaccharide heptosyltransferase I [Pseudomonadota bacterium]MBU1688308.1 lipopolysaccharide heptosyltransferase I [Pseudomonadota bacterium]
MNILIVKTSAIGDVTHTLPALNCLRRAFPNARIDWVVEEAAADLVVGHRAVDHVLISGRKRWLKELSQHPWRFFSVAREAIAFFRRLREVHYDLGIDFQGLLKSAVLVRLARARRRIGFDKGMQHAESSHLFYNERVPPVDMEVHALDRGLLLLAAIGIPCDQVDYDLPITQGHRARVKNLLAENNIDSDRPFVAIHPQTTWPTKHWDARKFAELADTLTSEGLPVVFTGGPTDRTAVMEITSLMKGAAVNLAGVTRLPELAAIFELARVTVATDTGPMHIAVAAGSRVVALFGPTAPWRTGPHGEGHRVIRAESTCSPCFQRKCDSLVCMRGITVSEVVSAVAALVVPVSSRRP